MNLANNELVRNCCWAQEALHPVTTLSDMPGEGAGISDRSDNSWL